MADKLRDQQVDLLKDSGPKICSLVRSELDADYKRIQNLEAALKTWSKFLENTKSVFELHGEEIGKIERMFQEIHAGMEQVINCDPESSLLDDLKRNLNVIKVNCRDSHFGTLAKIFSGLKRANFQGFDELLASMDGEFGKLNDLEEKLKEVADVKDIKDIRQKHWSLKKEQKERRYQLSVYALQMEEKLALWEHFNDRYGQVTP